MQDAGKTKRHLRNGSVILKNNKMMPAVDISSLLTLLPQFDVQPISLPGFQHTVSFYFFFSHSLSSPVRFPGIRSNNLSADCSYSPQSHQHFQWRCSACVCCGRSVFFPPFSLASLNPIRRAFSEPPAGELTPWVRCSFWLMTFLPERRHNGSKSMGLFIYLDCEGTKDMAGTGGSERATLGRSAVRHRS